LNIQPLKTGVAPAEALPGRISSICRKAAVSGGSSGGRLTQARAVMISPPKRTL